MKYPFGNVFLALSSVLISGVILVLPMPLLLRFATAGYLFFILPGSTVLSLSLKGQDRDTKLWKTALTVPVSLAVVGLVVLSINYLKLSQYNEVTILAVFSVDLILAFAAALKGGFQVPRIKNWWSGVKLVRPGFWQVAFFFSVLMLIGAGVYAALVPKHILPLTEFYLLTPDREMPASIDKQALADEGLIVGIGNHEGRNESYQVKVTTLSEKEEIVVWSSTYRVRNGEIQENLIHFSFPPEITGLQFNLFMGNDSKSYRSLNLIVK